MFIQFYKIVSKKVLLSVVIICGISAAALLKVYIHSSRSIDFEKKTLLADYICKLIEPRIQIGALRDVEDFLNSTSRGIDSNLVPFILLDVNGKPKPIGPLLTESEIAHACRFSGVANVKVEFHFKAEKPSFFQLAAVFILIFAVLIIAFLGFSWLALRFQRVFSELVSHLIRIEFSSNGGEPSSPPLVKGLISLLNVDVAILRDLRTQFTMLKQLVEDQNQKLLDRSRSDVLVSIASQVSHDIRSPLSALNMVMGSLKELPEEKRLLIRNATQRINDIANSLLHQAKLSSRNNNEANSVHTSIQISKDPIMLVALLDAIVSEKRTQFREQMDLEIQGELILGYGLFAKIDATEFARVVSNLINNSVEALSGHGKISVSIHGTLDEVTVVVRDNGKGIPPEILAHLGERGVSHGKDGISSGFGLGLYHARKTIEEVGGKFSIQSHLGSGVEVTMRLPRATTPFWFVERLSLPTGTTIVSVDDDQTIHQIWSGRLASVQAEAKGVKHLTFSSLEQLEIWVGKTQLTATFFLIDYEFLGQSANGLGIIERIGIAARSILVTSRYEEPQVRAQANSLGVKILPKALAPFVPLEIQIPREKYDAVVIDDDTTLVHIVWQMAAQKQDKRVICFITPEEFFKQSIGITFDSPLFIDVNLGDGISGVEVALKAADLGFTEIALATGFEASSLNPPSCVKRIVGKDPVF
jgi:signal transduction histidine kinase